MKWTSVKDSLPEHGQQVLTYTPDSDITTEKQRLIISGSVNASLPSGVTHWMPLPEPPKQNN